MSNNDRLSLQFKRACKELEDLRKEHDSKVEDLEREIKVKMEEKISHAILLEKSFDD